MNISEVRKILNPQFGYLAKSDGELLYAHHFMVWSIFRKIAEFVPSLDEKEKYLLEIACLIHDIGKMKASIQEALKKGKEPPEPHKVTSEDEIKKYFEKCRIEFDEKDLKFIADTIRTHHSVSNKDLEEISTPGAEFFTRLLSTADWLASMKYVSFETINKLQKIYRDNIMFTVFQYSRHNSPTACLIVKVAIKKYEENGWKVLCFPENGILFVGRKETKLPKKEDLVEEVYNEIIKESLSLQTPIPQRADRELLSFPANHFIKEFLEIHKNKIIDALGNIDQRGFVFFKYYKDICKSGDLKIKNDIVDIITSACGSAGPLRTQAKQKFRERFKEEAKNQKDVLSKLFYKIKLKDILTEEISLPHNISSSIDLKDLKPEDLYEILINLAKLKKEKNIKDFLLAYLNSIILMEEEIDFKHLAIEIFNKYKTYKETSKAEKGVCEICGCPVSFKMQPALNLLRTPQAFSQIKAKYDYRAICPFCIYDNLVFRKDVPSGKVTIYLRITNRVPDLFLNHEELKKLINKVRSGVQNPRRIARLIEDKELNKLPFSDIIEIPVGDEKTCGGEEIKIEVNNIFLKLESIDEKEYSPKDVKIKYEPLYHILKFLGFDVSIGTEEQEGLFGERIETNEESYYKSLATIIFATKIVKKESRKYIYARELIEKGPSVAITTMGKSIEDRMISKDLIKCLIKGMVKSKIVVARG